MKAEYVVMCLLPWIVGAIFSLLHVLGLVIVPMPPLVFVGSTWLVISPMATALAMLVAYKNGRDECK